MNAPTILMYNLDNKKGSRLRLLCLKLRIRVRAVSPAEYALPVGVLAGVQPMPETPPEPVEPFADEMLVMVNFGQKLLNTFLAQIRAEKLPGVALKAMLTPTNAQWSSTYLHQQISAEHAAMHYGRKPAHEGAEQ